MYSDAIQYKEKYPLSIRIFDFTTHRKIKKITESKQDIAKIKNMSMRSIWKEVEKDLLTVMMQDIERSKIHE